MAVLLAVYGSIQVWLSNVSYSNPLKRRFCAAWLCPQEFWETRTFIMRQQSAGGGSALMLPEFKRALATNPASAYAWANLAETEYDADQLALAKYCFQRALAAGPGDPAILFRAANFAFETGDREGTLRNISVILRNPDLESYYQPAFLTYSRLDAPIEELLDQGIPPVSSAAQPFLQFWMDDNKVAEASATWNWMVKHSLTSEKSRGSYLSFLVRNNQIDRAAEEWRRDNPQTASNYQVLNWIFNGGFETEPKAGPFDWHIETTPGVEATRVQDVSRDGQWSVRLVFGGAKNLDYHGVYQEAAITPGQWRIRAFFKLDGVTANQGIAVRVYDAVQPARLDIRTDGRAGTSSWNEVERAFAVGPETKLVRVEIMRGLSRTINSEKAGRAWVDSVELSPIR